MAGDGEGGGLYRPIFTFDTPFRPLYDLASWVNGLAFKDIHFAKSGLPVVKIAEVKGGIGPETKRTEGSYDEAVRLRDGDLLFCWSGQPECSIGTFRWSGGPAWLNQHIFKVTPGADVSAEYFKFLLRYLQPHFVRIAHNKQTTGLGHVTKADLRLMHVRLPSRREQDIIASVLAPLDDKIELNRRTAETLETIARALFRGWFVDFEPVHAKAEGLRSSLPDDFSVLFPDSIRDGLPTGWAVSSLREQFRVLSGGTPSKSEPIYWGGDIPWVTPRSMICSHVTDAAERVTSAAIGNGTRLAPTGSILVMVRGMGLHQGVRISQAQRDVTFNQDVKALVPEKRKRSVRGLLGQAA